MRLIDADAALDNIGAMIAYHSSITDAYEMVEDLPTVDAVPVIRCVDCKYSEHWYRDKRRCFLWSESGIDVFDDGYCNYGQTKAERKEE